MHDSELVIVRALNHLRLLHPPTYVTLRSMVDDLPDGAAGRAVAGILARKRGTHSSAQYLASKVAKDVAPVRTYRTFHLPSPTAALFEAAILLDLSRTDLKNRREGVYSYDLARDKSGLSFRHYYEGYRRRHLEIAEALQADPSLVAVVTDIKNFYPSIDTAALLRELKVALGGSQVSAPIQRVALHTAELLIDTSAPHGIPIGPAYSHFLGEVALRQLDAQYQTSRGCRYFRYVDDIVLLVPSNGAALATEELRDRVEHLSLRLNADKTDEISRDVWLDSPLQAQLSQETNQFSDLLQDIAVFLAAQPNQLGAVQGLFRDATLAMPIERLASLSRYRRFIAFFKGAWKRGLRRSAEIASLAVTSPQVLLDRAEVTRRQLRRELDTILSRPIPSSKTARKWHLQVVRGIANRLLYVTPLRELSELADSLPDEPEFGQLKIVVRCLSGGAVAPVLGVPGPVASTVGALWRTLSLSPARIDLESDSDQAVVDSVATLLTYGAVAIHSFQGPLRLRTQMLLDVCGHSPSRRRALRDLSWMDECQSLLLNKTVTDWWPTLSSRWSHLEEVALEGLRLDGQEYAS